jgi:MFS family permease
MIIAGLVGWLPAPYNGWAYVAAFVFYGSSGNLFQGIWTSWIRDCVPKPVRGRHFAWRNRFFSLVQLSCALTAGVISRHYSSQNAPWLLFTLIFFTGSLFRFGSGQFISWQYDPKPNKLSTRSQVFGFRPSRRFLHYCVSVALLQGATAIAGPFFSVWFLRDLKFDYLTFSIASASTVLGTILFLPLWGKLVDGVGNARVLQITGILCALVPVPYLFASSPVAVWLFNFYSGASWGGFNIANFNYLLHLTERDKSDHSIAVAAAATAISTFTFSLLGGFFSTRLPVFFGWQLQTLFGVSVLFRLAVVVGLFGLFGRNESRVLNEPMELAKNMHT